MQEKQKKGYIVQEKLWVYEKKQTKTPKHNTTWYFKLQGNGHIIVRESKTACQLGMFISVFTHTCVSTEEKAIKMYQESICFLTVIKAWRQGETFLKMKYND